MQQISKTLMKHLVEEHGKNTSLWPQELQDLINPSIEARSVSPPISGKVEKFINTNYHYHWAFDMCGQNPNHDRVESMRFAGWEFATTDDVQMCSESAVVGRKGDRKSKDGKLGFSDEIRSGDRRMMKLPMELWRQTKKAQNMAAYQMAYPQPFSEVTPGVGKPMTAESLVPGLKSEMMEPEEISETRRKATPANSVTVQKRAGEE
jgi:hypothetical protein